MKGLQLLLSSTIAVFAASCASTAVPAQMLTDCKASVRAAEAVEAENNPQAALHLKMARDQVQEAERLIKEDENERAEMILERAEADARMSMALSEESRAKAEAASAKRKVEELKKRASE